MDSYQLEDFEMDELFLQGLPVRCRAIIPLKRIQPMSSFVGRHLVVMLSNGRKYKGVVEKFEYVTIGDFAAGELILKKS